MNQGGGRWGRKTQSTFRQTFPECHVPQDVLQKGKGVGLHYMGKGGVSSGLVQPFGSFWGLACVYVHGLLTVLTLHSTAPFEFALALGDLLDSRGVVAPPTAHDLAAVCTTWCLIADPPSRAQGTWKEQKKVSQWKVKVNLNLVSFNFKSKWTIIALESQTQQLLNWQNKNESVFYLIINESINESIEINLQVVSKPKGNTSPSFSFSVVWISLL